MNMTETKTEKTARLGSFVAEQAAGARAAKKDTRLTHSSRTCAMTCFRKYFWAYELGIRPDVPSRPLRIGTAVHLGCDLLAQGKSVDEAAEAIRRSYVAVADPDAELECETACTLVACYAWYYAESQLQTVSSEQPFDMPLKDLTGRRSKWRAAGKTDRLVKDGGLVKLLERKTTGDDIAPESDYWRRLIIDGQISLYVLAAQAMGHDVQSAIYDAIRKPSIRPHQIPVLDNDGLKIVMDKAGINRIYNKNGKPRESASAADGYVLQTPTESVVEFCKRLADDVGKRPEFYFARHEVPRLKGDLEQYADELHQTALMLSYCQRHNCWPRNTSACQVFGTCPYFNLCVFNYDPASDNVPVGYVRIADVHPELQGENDHDSSTTSNQG